MLRTFDEHRVRETASLDGLWDFVIASDRHDRWRLPKSYTRTIHVPSAWEMLPGLENYRGKGWLRNSVESVDGKALRLVFGGVSYMGTVFVDGRKKRFHYDAFTPWDVVVPGLKAGIHEVVVEVDNSFGRHSALHRQNDYMTYGGITRPVEVQYVPEIFIDKIFATPVKAGGSWSLDVRVRLRNWSRKALKRTVVLNIAGTVNKLGTFTVNGSECRDVRGTIKSLDVKEWSPKIPNLYELEVLLFDKAELVDDMIDRIGFREIKVRGKEILLNGEPVRLRGYNRHEDHGCFGNAIPLEAMARDLEIMRDLGSNTVRTSHYPNDMRFLDLCDEMGFMVWEESHARTVQFNSPYFREQITNTTVEMVEWHFNRPSIVIWGCLNECDSKTDEGKKEHAYVLSLLKKLDPSRPTTFASNKRMNDICLGLVDIVSWNIHTGWYEEDAKETGKVLDALLKWLHSPKSRGGKGKPVIMSEFGAGAIPGFRDPRRCHWTEEFQCYVLDENLKVYLNHPQVAGSLIWQFCDVRVSEKFSPFARPRNINDKGTVDDYRRPKLSYDVVKKRMLEAAKKWDN